MKVKDIQARLEAKGIQKASPDHPIYSAPPTIRFINRSGVNPSRRKNALGKEKSKIN